MAGRSKAPKAVNGGRKGKAKAIEQVETPGTGPCTDPNLLEVKIRRCKDGELVETFMDAEELCGEAAARRAAKFAGKLAGCCGTISTLKEPEPFLSPSEKHNGQINIICNAIGNGWKEAELFALMNRIGYNIPPAPPAPVSVGTEPPMQDDTPANSADMPKTVPGGIDEFDKTVPAPEVPEYKPEQAEPGSATV